VLRAALASLNAPAEACFYTVREGSFDDLAAMGIGDPRGAIPAGYSLQDVQVRAWTAPAVECGTPTEGLQTSFNATWVRESGAGFGALFASAYSVAEGEQAYPGSANEYYANWSNGKFHFNVGAKIDPAPGDDSLIRALATALDPGFANACIAFETELSDADLNTEGIGSPTAPDGYSVTSRAHRGSSLTGNCSAEANANYSDSVSGNWVMTGPDGAIINVNAYKSPGGIPADEKRGYIGGNNIAWWNGDVQYNISGYNERGGEAPSLDTLIEVARSMDQLFDPDSLEKVPDGGGSSPEARASCLSPRRTPSRDRDGPPGPVPAEEGRPFGRPLSCC
jgi:hypothetical protein